MKVRQASGTLVFAAFVGLVGSFLLYTACHDFPPDLVQATPAPQAAAGGAVFFARIAPFVVNATDYWFADSGNSVTELDRQYAAPRSGTLRDLKILVTDALDSGTSITVTMRVNGADTGLTATVAGEGSGTVVASSASVAVTAGDLITFQTTVTGSVPPNGILNATVSFE